MSNRYINTTIHNNEAIPYSGASSLRRDILELVKIRITMLVAFTTALGYILASDSLSLGFIYPVVGIFILACSSAALNQYQERNLDKLMARTTGRPIPAGRMTEGTALIISLSLLILGSVILLAGTNLMTLTVGLATYVSYNFIYTPLKRKIALAIIPGSLVGALPPVAGWVAAGGNMFDEKIILVAAYFFIWQIPHFWLLLLKYGKQYEGAGFPALTETLSRERIAKLIFFTTILTVIPVCILFAGGMLNYFITGILLLAASVWLLVNSYKFTKSDLSNKNVTRSFIGVNIYTLIFITLLSLDKLINLT
jgi:protoheme IX farnesyltransferase